MLRQRINLWPALPFQVSEPRVKFKQKKFGSFAAKEREVQDEALSKACKLLQAEKEEEVSVETIAAEMSRLHPEGPDATVDYVP